VAKDLPEEWTNGTLNTLYVVRDLGLKKSGVPADLRITRKRGKTTQVLYAQYLPAEEDDPRQHAGRTRNGKGRRVVVEVSTKHSDPFQAGRAAIEWVLDHQRKSKATKAQQEQDAHHNLHAYWEGYFAKESRKRESTRGFARWKRDESLKWEGEGYGIKHQPWSNKPVDQINALDLEDYWSVLDQRRTPKNDMGGTKKQQKTLIRKLLKEARQDFPRLGIPDFPEISSQKQQVRHLKREEWERLLKKVVELSEGAARKDLSVSEYQDLQFSKGNNQNQRNWVDLYDCLNLMWFFYFRAEDLPRIKAEWFQERKDDDGEEFIDCFVEETKGHRDKYTATPFRPDAVQNWRRMNQRRPKGFLVFPHTKRSAGETNSTLKRTWNLLLRAALDACGIPSEGMTMTNIRHTAFRLTLEEAPELGTQRYIHSFAANAGTSPQMLQDTYLRFIERESTAKQMRAKIKPGIWSLVLRRVGDPD
jgi:hypothetical protein